MDLGVSSMQIDQADRGFAYMQNSPLDMRMDPTQGQTALELLAELDVADLRQLLIDYGESRRPSRIAKAILARRDRGEMTSSADLRAAVQSVVGARQSTPEIARVFQALRIHVNGELTALDTALAALPNLLQVDGRAVVISYHSLEDRRVKQRFAQDSRGCICPPELPVCACGHKPQYELLTRRTLRPSPSECESNPRARSARLRAVRRIAS